MPPQIAAFAFVVGIAGLFWLDRGSEAKTSKALWLPTIWLLLTCSRPVSFWLGMMPPASSTSVYLEGSPVDRAVFICLVVTELVVLTGRKERIGPILRKNWPIVSFFVFAALSILWSGFPLVTFKHWVKGIGDLMAVLIVLTETSVTEAIKRLVTRVGFTLLPLSVLLCKYYPHVGSFVNRSWQMEWTGVTMQKNTLGAICAVLGLGLLWRFRSAFNDREDPRRHGRLLALGTVLGMTIWLLWMSGSLTSICAVIMAGGVMLLSARPSVHRRPALVHVLIAAVLSVALYALFFQSSKALVEDLGRTPTMSGRTDIWSDVLGIPDNRLVGKGYETFWVGPRLQEVWAEFGMNINEAHNGYIEMLLNLGWIGVGLLGILIATGYRNAIGAYRRDSDDGGVRAGFFLMAVISAFSEAAFRMMYPTWTFFLLATIALPMESARESSVSEGSAESRLDLAQEYTAGAFFQVFSYHAIRFVAAEPKPGSAE